MADILATWLNEEVGLSKKITNFEQDFASGYHLGELLYKFNQQNDFELFSTKDINTHKMKNFEKLEPTLRNLNIKFDSTSVDKIMKGERGYALRLLYQLKMVLEKVYPPTDIVVLTKTGTFGDNQPAQKIANPLEKYDRIQHDFFKHRLAALNKPQKQINMDQHLLKFESEHQRQSKVAADDLEAEKQAATQKKQDLRRIQINKLQRNAGFMEEWQQKGIEDWKKNQKKKKEREMEQLDFDYKQAQKFNAIAVKKLDDAHAEVFDGIAKFENSLKTQGISTKANPDRLKNVASNGESIHQTSVSDAEKVQRERSMNKSLTKLNAQDTKLMQTKTGAFTLTSTGLKQRTKKTLNDESRTARAKRRRRLIGQQEEFLVELEQSEREQMVLELMKRQAAQEKELEYEVWRTTQCKQVIVENRNLRESQYARRKELDTQIAESKEIQILNAEQQQNIRLVGERLCRDQEMRGYEQDAKKKAHKELCASLLDKIIDIADEAYKHQQKIDSKNIDPRNWHEWLQLFINEKPIANTHDKLSKLVTEETAGEQSTKLETEEDEANLKLDELEMIDYIKNQGQWSKELVANNKPNLEQIMNPPVEQVQVAGKKAAPAKGQAVQQEIQFDPDDLELKDQPENNFYLGDAVDTIIKLNHEDRPKLKHPKTPSWLPLKLAFVGYPFSGKKHQAGLLKEQYGLNVFCMDELIESAINFARANPRRIAEANAQVVEQIAEDLQALGLNDLDELSEDEEGEINCKEDFRQCGLEIEKLLLEGEEVSDELYVKLFVTQLRMTYEYKSPFMQRNEVITSAKNQVDLQTKLNALEEELTKEGIQKKRQKVIESNIEKIKKELDIVGSVQEQGWVLVDFPCTYAQAKLLEKALSGYEPEEDKEMTERQKQLSDAMLLVQPNPKPAPPQKLIKSGLDAVVWFNCDISESQRRADGRREYRENEEDNPVIYHVEDVQPPVNQAPLCERLRHIEDDSNATGSLVDRYVSFDQATRSLKTWLHDFGVDQINRRLMQDVNAGYSIKEVQDEIKVIVEDIMAHKRNVINAQREQFVIQIETAREERIKQLKIEEEKQKEKEALELAAVEQKPAEPNPRESLLTVKSAENKLPAQPGAQTPYASTAKLQTSISVDPLPTAEFVRQRLDNDFKPVIIQLWNELSVNYKGQMKKIFKNFRLQREQTITRRFDIQNKFLTFLHNADGKQAILDEFVDRFNLFSDEYPDLREDKDTKEELHQRTDVFSDELWEIVEERKEQSIEFRKQIMESGSCEFALAFITTIAQQLMQAELDKFKVSVQILQDYYHAIEERLIPEAAPSTTVELGFDEGDAPAVESLPEGADATNADLYTYPRLDKLLLLALKQQVITDYAQQAQAVDPKKGAPKGKAPPAKGAQQVVEEEKVEDSVYVKELKEALKVEKGIFRYRLVQIRNWSLKNLRECRRDFIGMYRKLEDWIFVAQRAEMEAIDQLCVLIKQHIESEKKIKPELRIKFMDFTIDRPVLNFITPPPPLLPAVEDYREDRFSIDQLKFLQKEFQTMEASQITREQFREKSVIEMFISKKNASVGFGGYTSALPATWNSLGQSQIRHLVINLDLHQTGLINWKTMFTYFCLLRSSIPTASDISTLKSSCRAANGLVSHDSFMKAKFWFEKSESSVDRPGSHVFERSNMIKQMLFETHCKVVQHCEDVMVDINSLCDIFETPTVQHPKAKFENYNEFLFAPIKTN